MRAYLSLFAGAVAALLLAPQARAEDTTPPVIVYSPPAAGTQPKGPFTVSATITDESKFYPQVFFRRGPGAFAKPLDMKKKAGAKDVYEATIPYASDSIEFYIEAYDEAGNGPARAGDPDKPFALVLGVTPPPPPPAPVATNNSASKPSAPSSATSSGSGSSSKPASSNRSSASASNSGGGGGRVWTWVVGGVGLGLLTGGLVAGLAVKTEDDAFKTELAGNSNGNGTTQVNGPTGLAAQQSANASLGTKATILTISGAVLLAGGVALFFLEPTGDDSAASSGRPNGNPNATPAKPGKGAPKEPDGPGFTGENDEPAPAPLPAVSSISVGAAPVQGGAAVAIAGHF